MPLVIRLPRVPQAMVWVLLLLLIGSGVGLTNSFGWLVLFMPTLWLSGFILQDALTKVIVTSEQVELKKPFAVSKIYWNELLVIALERVGHGGQALFLKSSGGTEILVNLNALEPQDMVGLIEFIQAKSGVILDAELNSLIKSLKHLEKMGPLHSEAELTLSEDGFIWGSGQNILWKDIQRISAFKCQPPDEKQEPFLCLNIATGEKMTYVVVETMAGYESFVRALKAELGIDGALVKVELQTLTSYLALDMGSQSTLIWKRN